ncbi:MAG: hypothetical protein Q8R98_10325 [Rubrivivax sp.]|nr:hypothetical protein [Rubrivivax sp.]MDP3224382.1 hypothetical protein [Rubrivivax sp.]MDP3612238.1 hypothetical protein [Rubrivivax sp.]
MADERAQIAAERAALDQRFAQEERDCANRFVVNACIDDVRRQRRESLQPLRERELSLDEAERMRRAAERRAVIAAKQAAAASRPGAVAGPPTELRLREAVQAPAPPSRPIPRTQDEAGRAAEAAQRVREADRRREEAQAHQRRVQDRQAERAATGRQAAPLPVPSASAAAR